MVNYQDLYSGCQLTTDPKRLYTLSWLADRFLQERVIYETVERFSSIPWPLVAIIHFRESSMNFNRHLHNGDPLSARTVHAPKGRPVQGEPPFTWIESAVDALSETWRPGAWTMAGCLEFMERYNGLGYQKRGVMSPYLWNYTNLYTQGLFTADGQFDPVKTEMRPGCVALVKTLESKGVSLDFTSLDACDSSLH